MPTVAWVLLWVAVIATVAFLVVRERRSGRRSGAVKRHDHAAAREADLNREGRGPNGSSSTWVG
jgi:hypothetical protein